MTLCISNAWHEAGHDLPPFRPAALLCLLGGAPLLPAYLTDARLQIQGKRARILWNLFCFAFYIRCAAQSFRCWLIVVAVISFFFHYYLYLICISASPSSSRSASFSWHAPQRRLARLPYRPLRSCLSAVSLSRCPGNLWQICCLLAFWAALASDYPVNGVRERKSAGCASASLHRRSWLTPLHPFPSEFPSLALPTLSLLALTAPGTTSFKVYSATRSAKLSQLALQQARAQNAISVSGNFCLEQKRCQKSAEKNWSNKIARKWKRCGRLQCCNTL